jgi:Holliday junction resolvase-like predicted endonuclease
MHRSLHKSPAKTEGPPSNTLPLRAKVQPLPVIRDRAAIGAAAEREAAAALACAGWQILARNLRVDGLEIDILARDEAGRLVAVEVRARRSIGEATPTEILGQKKRAALRRQREAISGLLRVDLLIVAGPPGARRLRLVRGVAERGTRWGEGGKISRHPIRGPLA